MMAKHLDAQLALVVTPEFNNGLPPSLVGDPDDPMNVGLKSLQVTTSSLMPHLGHAGLPVVDRFPTHAEQFNQNVNSQSMTAANLTREAIDSYTHFLGVALLTAVQAVELRSHVVTGTYDATGVLSPATARLYAAARTAALGPPDAARPLHWRDLDEFIQPKLEGILAALGATGPILETLGEVRGRLRRA